LRHEPFEGCKERGVIEGPFGGFLQQCQQPDNSNQVCARTDLVIPFLHRKRMSDSKPIPVHFKVRRLAVTIATRLDLDGGEQSKRATHYAGNSSTLKAAATMAHCTNEG
jgi:hypothetical protein